MVSGGHVKLTQSSQNDAQAHCLKTTEPVVVLVDEPLAKQLGPEANQLFQGTKVGPVSVSFYVAELILTLPALLSFECSAPCARCPQGCQGESPVV
jgi:hypothetical protein